MRWIRECSMFDYVQYTNVFWLLLLTLPNIILPRHKQQMALFISILILFVWHFMNIIISHTHSHPIAIIWQLSSFCFLCVFDPKESVRALKTAIEKKDFGRSLKDSKDAALNNMQIGCRLFHVKFQYGPFHLLCVQGFSKEEGSTWTNHTPEYISCIHVSLWYALIKLWRDVTANTSKAKHPVPDQNAQIVEQFPCRQDMTLVSSVSSRLSCKDVYIQLYCLYTRP